MHLLEVIFMTPKLNIFSNKCRILKWIKYLELKFVDLAIGEAMKVYHF